MRERDQPRKDVSWLVVFYSQSTFVVYLMPNPCYTYLLNLYHL